MDKSLEILLVSKLNFIQNIQEFLPEFHYKEEREVLNLHKQYSDYDFAAQILWKIQRKYSKKWF